MYVYCSRKYFGGRGGISVAPLLLPFARFIESKLS